MSLNFNAHSSAEGMVKIHRHLSHAQAVPVIGFILVSPIKAAIGIAEATIGCAIAIIAFVGHLLTFGRTNLFTEVAEIGGQHILVGSFATGYAFANIISFGLLGLIIEPKFCDD